MADSCCVCGAPAGNAPPHVCSRCRPAFDQGRRVGLQHAIQVIGERLKPTHPEYRALVASLTAIMPSGRR